MAVALDIGEGARLVFCSSYCIWAFGCGDPEAGVEYEIREDCCVWCAGCGARLDLNGAACSIHGDACFTLPRWFLRTQAAATFCRLYRERTGRPLSISTSIVWRRAIAMWSAEEFAGADGLELFAAVMRIEPA